MSVSAALSVRRASLVPRLADRARDRDRDSAVAALRAKASVHFPFDFLCLV